MIHIRLVIDLSIHSFARSLSNPFCASFSLASCTALTSPLDPSTLFVSEEKVRRAILDRGTRWGRESTRPAAEAVGKCLYLLICVGVTVALGNFGLKYRLRVLGSSNVRYLIMKALMTSATSRPKMIVAIVQVAYLTWLGR